MVNRQVLPVQLICHKNLIIIAIFKLIALGDTLVYESLTNYGLLFPVVCFVFVSGLLLV